MMTYRKLANKKHLQLLFLMLNLCMLLLNDFVWKHSFHNAITGKLSDFTGIVVLYFALYVLLNTKSIAVFITIALFIFWKSPASQSCIDWINLLTNASLKRVVDYSDLLALVMLIPSYFIFNERKVQFHTPIYLLSWFAIVSTSRYEPGQYGIYFVDQYDTLSINKEEVLNRLEKKEITYTFKSKRISNKDTLFFYDLSKIIRSNDTIFKASFYIKSTHDQKTILNIDEIHLTEYNTYYTNHSFRYNDSIQQHFKDEMNMLLNELGQNEQ